MFEKILKFYDKCGNIYLIFFKRLFGKGVVVHMSIEEYKERILCMLKKITDINMLKKIYTVVKVLYESRQKG